ncbi:MAG: ABC transporter ATP-binding protein [Clostridia bacterium]|nr:ABC transporter ATP-binding protein [Clostridia bacterium]
MIKKLLSFTKGYKKATILAPITMIGEVLAEVMIPFLIQYMSKGMEEGSVETVVTVGAIMIALAFFALFCGIMSARYACYASTGFAKNLRRALFSKVQDLSFKNTDKFTTASLVTRLTTDVNNTQMAFMMCIRMMVRAPLMLICATTLAFIQNAELAVIFVVAIPILAVCLGFIMSKAHPKFKIMLKKFDYLNRTVQENLIGARVVKSFVREDFEEDKFKEASEAVRQTQVKAERIIICQMPIVQMVMYATTVAVILLGGNVVLSGNLAIAELSSFLSYGTQILMSLTFLSMAVMMFTIAGASIGRIGEVFNEVPDIRDDEADANLVPKDGEIVFKNVNFNYAGKKEKFVLKNFNLTIPSGSTVGVIGGTGSAKTTFVQLIPRLYDATEGEVLVGGRNVKDYKLKNLRENVAMVLQKNVLFSGTIRDNLKWGNKDATDEQIIEAAKSAAAHDFIMSFPDGYDSWIEQGGVNVSGGQKQRLCIARALLSNPKVLILDDSTSAVDTATDAMIRKGFKEHISDSTVIIIAQRINSVKDADFIVVLDEGEIKGVGTHEELMNTNDIYREVYDSQQRGDE